VDLNLDKLKREILDYIEASGFAVFHSAPGTLDSLPAVSWDSERLPDYRAFLETARKVGTALVVFSSSELDSADVDELTEQLEDCGLTREEKREYTSRLRDLRMHEGQTCGIELAFDYNSRIYVFDLHPDWYEDYLSIDDEISVRLAGDDGDDDGGDGLPGYFSKN